MVVVVLVKVIMVDLLFPATTTTPQTLKCDTFFDRVNSRIFFNVSGGDGRVLLEIVVYLCWWLLLL